MSYHAEEAERVEFIEKTVETAIAEALTQWDKGEMSAREAIESIYDYCANEGLFNEQ